MPNISNQTGRAFEYAIVNELAKLPGVSLTDRAAMAQRRDKPKFERLEPLQSNEFCHASRVLAQTFTAPPYAIGAATIDRLTDNDARKGDVTDIRIQPSLARHPINLSVKNNHFALKHQRPPSLMQQLGFVKGSDADIEYRVKLQEIFDSFHRTGKSICPSARLFRELKDIDQGFIDRCLYAPVCRLVSSTLRSYLADSIACQTFFSFLVGNIDFIKVILYHGCLEFENFSQIALPSCCRVGFSHESPSYVFLAFDNEWEISMRLHTASSRLASIGKIPSLKFDTQAMNMPVQRTRIHCR